VAKKYYMIAFTTSFFDTNGALAGLDLLETFVSTHISTNNSNFGSIHPEYPFPHNERGDASARPWPKYTKQMSFLWQKWKRVLNLGDAATRLTLPGFYQFRYDVPLVHPSISAGASVFSVMLNALKASMYQELGLVDLDIRSFRNSLRPSTYREIEAAMTLCNHAKENSPENSHPSSVHFLTVSSDITEGLDALWDSAVLAGINLQV
jgi:hypothetical protein